MSSDGVADTEQTMQINPQRAQVLAENLSNVLQRVDSVAAGRKACSLCPRPYPGRSDVLTERLAFRFVSLPSQS